MKIQSKKTSRIHDVSQEQWDEMGRRQESRLFIVIDDSDEPVSVVDIEPVELDSEEGIVKRKLDDAGIYYHPNTGIKKLKQKLEEYEESNDERSDEALQQD